MQTTIEDSHRDASVLGRILRGAGLELTQDATTGARRLVARENRRGERLRRAITMQAAAGRPFLREVK